MTDCCVYYLAQIKSRGIWVDLGSQSKDLSQVNKEIAQYLSSHGWAETRIIQRSVKDDRAAGRKVPRCC